MIFNQVNTQHPYYTIFVSLKIKYLLLQFHILYKYKHINIDKFVFNYNLNIIQLYPFMHSKLSIFLTMPIKLSHTPNINKLPIIKDDSYI